MTKTYHSKVYMPAALKAIAANLYFQSLIWSKHAQLEIVRDKYGRIPGSFVPQYVSGAEWELVELEVLSGRPTKYVFRRPVDATRSLVIVVCPHGAAGAGFVKTCWVNMNTDKHRTLDRSKYAAS